VTIPERHVSVTSPTVMSLSLLPSSLRAMAEHHLASSESVLAAVYLPNFRDPPNVRWHGTAAQKRPMTPGRALIVTHTRVLILDDPIDRATTSAARQYVVGSCPIDAIVAVELRSHLLDCAMAFVHESDNGTQRMSISFSGVNEPSLLDAVGILRRVMNPRQADPGPESSFAVPVEHMSSPARATTEISYRQRYYLQKYASSSDRLQGILGIPALRGTRLVQRISLLAHEQPPMLLARTDRQVLLVKNAPRTLRREASYGCDAWLLPLHSVRTAGVRHDQSRVILAFGLGASTVCYNVEFAIPTGSAEDVAAFARAIPSTPQT
jgi:hypothetical protein